MLVVTLLIAIGVAAGLFVLRRKAIDALDVKKECKKCPRRRYCIFERATKKLCLISYMVYTIPAMIQSIVLVVLIDAYRLWLSAQSVSPAVRITIYGNLLPIISLFGLACLVYNAVRPRNKYLWRLLLLSWIPTVYVLAVAAAGLPFY